MILLLTLLACVSDPRGGTAVGNPTGFTVDTAPVTSFKMDSGSAVIEEVRSRPCDGTEQSTPVDHGVDLYGSTVVLADADRSCVLTIAFAGPLVYIGQHQGREVRLEVPLAEVAFRGPPGGIPGGSRLLLQLGSADWVVASQLAHGRLAEGQAQVVADTLRAGSLLYTDMDGDFAIGPAEIEAGPMARALPSTPGQHADVGAGGLPARRAAPGAGTAERLHDDGGEVPADDAADVEDEGSTDDPSIDPDGAAGSSDHGSTEERASAPDEHAADDGETSTDRTERAEAATDASGTSTEDSTRPDEGSTDPDDAAPEAADTGATEPESGTSTDSDDAGEPSSTDTTDEPDAGEPGADDTSSTEHEDPEEDADVEADDTDYDADADDEDRTDSGRHAGRGRNPLPGARRGPWRDRSTE